MTARTTTALVFVIGLLATTACPNTGTKLCTYPSGEEIRCPAGHFCAANQAACISGACGNGIPEPELGEECDDGDMTNGDGCSDTCKLEQCGNGIPDPGEECDDGGDSKDCDVDCTRPECGDAYLNRLAGEDCDTGGESYECNANCTIARCGDGLINSTWGEQCDDEGETSNCDRNCTIAFCGDRDINLSRREECDTEGESSTCDSDCTTPQCGDGMINGAAGEECDTEGESSTCDRDCTTPLCGDGVPNASAGETCDTGVDTSTCDDDCTLPACGDGHPNAAANEDCDDGNTSNGDNCVDQCMVATCGDGYIDQQMPGLEHCDLGTSNPDSNGCTYQCMFTQGLTCDPSELNHLGEMVNGVSSGLRVLRKSFLAIGDEEQLHVIPYPPGYNSDDCIPLPLVHTNLQQQTWEITSLFVPIFDNFALFKIVTDNEDFDSIVAGDLNLLCFDPDPAVNGSLFSSYACAPTDPWDALTDLMENESAHIDASEMATRTKVIPLVYRTSQQNGGQYWSWFEPSTDNNNSACDVDFDSYASGDLRWRACSLFLSESIRVEQQEFAIDDNSPPIDIDFELDPNAYQVWFPVIERISTPGGMSYIFSCATVAADTLSCTLTAWNHLVSASYAVEGRIILLESHEPF